MSTQPKEVAKWLNRLRGDQPWRRESSLLSTGGSVRMNLDMEGVRHAGIDPDEPGKVTQWYFPKHEIFIIDIGGNYGDE